MLKQVVEFRKTGNSMRLQSPVLQQWPWDNGLPLQHGLMGERMRQLLSTTDHEPVFVAMVLVSKLVQVSCHTYLCPLLQKFTDALDNFDKVQSFEHHHRDFIWEFLGCQRGNHSVDARSTMLNLDHWDNSTPATMESAVHVLLRYKLLDILSGVLEIETHPARQTISQVPMSNLPGRVQQVCTSIAQHEIFLTYPGSYKNPSLIGHHALMASAIF